MTEWLLVFMVVFNAVFMLPWLLYFKSECKHLKLRLEDANASPEPCVEGECCWRYPGGKSKCNRPHGHDGDHGKISECLPGFILAPHPNRESVSA